MEYEARLAVFVDPPTERPGFEAELVSASGQVWQRHPEVIANGETRQLAWLKGVRWILDHTRSGDKITWINTTNAIALHHLIVGNDRDRHQTPYYQHLYAELDQRASSVRQADGFVQTNPFGLPWDGEEEGAIDLEHQAWDEAFDQWTEERQTLLTEIQRLEEEVQRLQDIAHAGQLQSREQLRHELQDRLGTDVWRRLAPYQEGLLTAEREREVAEKTGEDATYRDAVLNIWKVFEQALKSAWMGSIARWIAQQSLSQSLPLWRERRKEVVIALMSTSSRERTKLIRWPLEGENLCTLGDMEQLLFDHVNGQYVRPENWVKLLNAWANNAGATWLLDPSFYAMLESGRAMRNPHAHTFPQTTVDHWTTVWDAMLTAPDGWIVRLTQIRGV